MKKPIVTSLALVAFDQAVKLVIAAFVPGAQVTLIPGMLYFHPVRNTNLNWLASMANYHTPVGLMVVLQALMLALVVLLYRYLAFRGRGKPGLLSLFFSFAAAGICCSFIDVVCWGGSLDFLGLFDWFVFDTKDVYLNASYITLAFWEIGRMKDPAGDTEGIRGGFKKWLSLGCPMKPQNTTAGEKS